MEGRVSIKTPPPGQIFCTILFNSVGSLYGEGLWFAPYGPAVGDDR
jgi:hypothetical protein